jgi:hypothetical protein
MLRMSPAQIVEEILNIDNWKDFKGYGFLPGIKKAEFEVKTPGIVGTRIRVTNSDNSSHVEEIVEWIPDQRLTLHFSQFSAPLSKLASGFDEIWEFERVDNQTKVTRSFEMHAKSILTWPVLKLISFVLKKAIAKHLHEMKTNG